MVGDLNANPDLRRMFDEVAVAPAKQVEREMTVNLPPANDPNHNVQIPPQKISIEIGRTLEQNINSVGECVAAQNSTGLLSECMGAMTNLTNEAIGAVKPQLPTIPQIQTVGNTTTAPAANTSNYALDVNSPSPGGMG